jgi:photosystem II stability/assembly factor-like uncharacterized protein
MRTMTVMIVAMLAGSMQLAAQGWKQIYPAYEAENYTSIFNGGGDTLYITGMNFTLLRSVDRGAHWEKIFRTPDAYDIWRAGYDGKRVYLLPGGERLREELIQDSTHGFLFAYDPATNDTTRISFPFFGQQFSKDRPFTCDLSVTRDAIFVLETPTDTTNFALLRSRDGGATWTRIPAPVPERLRAYSTIRFRDANHGFLWAVDTAAGSPTFVLYSTKDGGAHWLKHPEFRQSDGSVPIEHPLCWLTDSSAAVIDLAGSMYLTTDAGDTWKLKSSPPISRLVSLVLHPNGTGYGIGKSFDMVRTTDFGATWMKIREPFIYAVESKGAMIGDSCVVVISSKGYRIRTQDAGVSWNDDQITELLLIGELLFFDRFVGYCSSMYNLDGTVLSAYYRSSNSGATWTPLEALRGRWLAMMPVSASVVYAMSAVQNHSDSLIMKSTNGGRSWELNLKDTIPGFHPSRQFVFSGCMNRGVDTVFLYSDSTLLRSYDGGRSWRRIPCFPVTFTKQKEWLVGMDMRSKTFGWALSTKKVMRTQDDGVHWDTVFVLPQGIREFMSLSADEGRRVYVVARDDNWRFEGFRSTDAGTTWSHAPIPAYRDGAHRGGVGDFLPDGSGVQLRSRGNDNVIEGQRVSFQRTNDSWMTCTTEFAISRGIGSYNQDGTTFSLDRNTAWAWFGDRIYFTSTGGIDAADAPREPTSLALSQNYPNPFTTHTTIPYSIAGSGEQQLRIELYDAMGRRIATLFDGSATAGEYVLPFDASGFVPGMYFVRLVTGWKTEVRKMVVLGGR